MSEHRECLFLPGRRCNLEVDEIPLDVCRLCLEAFRDYASKVFVKLPTIKRAEEAASSTEAKSEPQMHRKREVMASLSELNRRIFNNEITLQEYLEKRKEVVQRLRESPSTHLT